ncbi:hypothetical protein P6U20_29485, partial [Bacillus paranthracis]|uniref:hypothetical protein n=1 Tax=Bacillus paranthracis TaxID=2026186 RepID=UPI0024086E8D
SHEKGKYQCVLDDYVTIIVRYLYAEDTEEELYYHETITQKHAEGLHAVLDDDKSKEQYFAFADIEKVIQGHLIPFLGGYTRRQDI